MHILFYNNRLCYLVQSKSNVTALRNNHQNDHKMKIYPELKKVVRSIF